MVSAIEAYQGLRALRLEGNTVGVAAAEAIAKALEKKSELQVCISFAYRLYVLGSMTFFFSNINQAVQPPLMPLLYR